jgi:hypothetical protein
VSRGRASRVTSHHSILEVDGHGLQLRADVGDYLFPTHEVWAITAILRLRLLLLLQHAPYDEKTLLACRIICLNYISYLLSRFILRYSPFNPVYEVLHLSLLKAIFPPPDPFAPLPRVAWIRLYRFMDTVNDNMGLELHRFRLAEARQLPHSYPHTKQTPFEALVQSFRLGEEYGTTPFDTAFIESYLITVIKLYIWN